MLCWRWAGERRSARPTRPDTPDGMIQENCGRSGALPWSRTSRTWSSLPPKKRFPKSISNTRSPSAKTSLRGSVRLPDRPPDGILDERELRGIVGQRRGQDGHGEEVAEERVPGLVRRPRRAVAELLQHLVPAGDEGVALPRRGFDSSVVSRSLHAGCCSADAEGQDLCQEASRKSQVGRKRRASIA